MSSGFKSVFKFLRNAVIGFLALTFWVLFLTTRFVSDDNEVNPPSETKLRNDQVEEIIRGRIMARDTELVVQDRCWKDLEYPNDYCIKYAVPVNEIREQFDFRENKLKIKYQEGFTSWHYWNQVYAKSYYNNKDQLLDLIDSLDLQMDYWRLGQHRFANYLVSMVQDMPYWFVMPEGCEGKKSSPCIEHIRFGLLSPSEMAGLAVGDCDSRSLLLYMLLRHFDYDVVVLTSDKYAHAMLGINLPATGEYIAYQGKRYYFWETTATGWEIGMIPPSSGKKKYWEIALHADA